MTIRVGGTTIDVTADRDVRQAHRPYCSIEGALIITRVGNTRIVTHHRIDDLGKNHVIGRGEPVDKSSAITLLESIRDADTESDGWINPNVLFHSDRTLAWHVPGIVRGLYYKHGKAHTMRVPWPNLLFVARRGGDLQLFATESSERPSRSTKLYHAPLANVNEAGLMCWGSADCPRFGLAGIPAYEDAVFRTWFTHPNHQRAIATNRGGDYIFAFYSQLRDSKAKRFPAKALVPTKLTLEKVCGP